MPVDRAGDRVGRGEDDLAQHDDREQLVALRDVVAVPRRAGPDPLGPVGGRHLQHRQHHERDDDRRPVVRQQQAQDPEDLDDATPAT